MHHASLSLHQIGSLHRAEAAFAKRSFEDQANLNQKARASILGAAVSRQITIRLSDAMVGMAKQQAQAKGLPYQTYIKMLLHEALTKARQ